MLTRHIRTYGWTGVCLTNKNMMHEVILIQTFRKLYIAYFSVFCTQYTVFHNAKLSWF